MRYKLRSRFSVGLLVIAGILVVLGITTAFFAQDQFTELIKAATYFDPPDFGMRDFEANKFSTTALFFLAGALVGASLTLVVFVMLGITVRDFMGLIRSKRGLCPQCAYQLQHPRGHQEGCPECGWNRPESERTGGLDTTAPGEG